MHRRMQYYSYSLAVMMATCYLNFSEEELSTSSPNITASY